MKKKIFFLILLCAVFLSCGLNVHAEEKKFYESDFINMYLKRQHSSNMNMIYYQQARIYREQASNEEVMCVEPNIGTDINAIYHKNIPSNLNNNQIERIKLLSYFGHMYPNHKTAKWYMVTQLLIWKTVDPNGRYYFTDTLNGNETYKYDGDINALNSLVNDYLTKPNISIAKAYKANSEINLIDSNNMLSKYKTNIGRISGNKLILNNLDAGEYTITLTRTFEKTGREAAFYTSDTSQNMYMRGDIDDISIDLKIKVVDTSLKIIKKDKDGEEYNTASLKNTKFKLINILTKEEKELIINENNTAIINNLNFGKYKLIETEAGIGYKTNSEEYSITIDENNPKIEIEIENEVIKKEISIHKSYGEHDFKSEANITFEIYDEENNLYATYTTDNEGYIKFTLPYGSYTLKQVNSTEGYQKIEPIKLNIEDEDSLFIELKDYKIKVPNTYSNKSVFSIILKFLLLV